MLISKNKLNQTGRLWVSLDESLLSQTGVVKIIQSTRELPVGVEFKDRCTYVAFPWLVFK